MSKRFLADFHVHSNFSDGKHPIPELVDMYGEAGFGAIGFTDHISEHNTFIGKAAVVLNQVLTEATFPLYRELLKSEAARAWDRYRLIVVTGFELSQNSILNHRSAHILGLGIDQYIAADGDPIDLAAKIQSLGGLAIAAHPVFSGKIEKQTFHLWDRREELANSFDAWEVASGSILFKAVAKSKLPKIASSDLHIKRQFSSWKSVFHCERKQEAIFDAIRRQKIDFTYYTAAAA